MSNFVDILSMRFRPDSKTDATNTLMRQALDLKTRADPARIAIALSLSDERQLPDVVDVDGEKGTELAGRTLFSADNWPLWLALFTQHANRTLTVHEVRDCACGHWARGISVLREIWESSDRNFGQFLDYLAENTGVVPTERIIAPFLKEASIGSAGRLGPVDLLVGTEKGGAGRDVNWTVNSPGHPPHIAVLGATNTGKTRLALRLAEEIQRQSNCIALFFDMGKGDIASNETLLSRLQPAVHKIPAHGAALPLDIFHIANRENQSEFQNVAAGFCNSVSLASRKLGDVQSNNLRKALRDLLSNRTPVTLNDLRDEVEAASDKESIVSAILDKICDYELFSPVESPGAFFSQSRIFDLHEAEGEIQRLTVFLLFDALNRYLKRLSDSSTDDDGNTQLRILIVVDEARKVLGFQHESLVEIVRLSRSKGGVVTFISQSPDDFVKEQTNFLENIGLTACFQTNAQPSAARKVFPGAKKALDLAALERGTCLVKIAGEQATKQIQHLQVWQQDGE